MLIYNAENTEILIFKENVLKVNSHERVNFVAKFTVFDENHYRTDLSLALFTVSMIS